MTPKAQATKEKLDKLIHKIKNCPMCIKGQYQESEKITHSMGENICKSHI